MLQCKKVEGGECLFHHSLWYSTLPNWVLLQMNCRYHLVVVVVVVVDSAQSQFLHIHCKDLNFYPWVPPPICFEIGRDRNQSKLYSVCTN